MSTEELGILSPYAKFNICWASRFYHIYKTSDTFISAHKSITLGNVFLMIFWETEQTSGLGSSSPPSSPVRLLLPGFYYPEMEGAAGNLGSLHAVCFVFQMGFFADTP